MFEQILATHLTVIPNIAARWWVHSALLDR